MAIDELRLGNIFSFASAIGLNGTPWTRRRRRRQSNNAIPRNKRTMIGTIIAARTAPLNECRLFVAGSLFGKSVGSAAVEDEVATGSRAKELVWLRSEAGVGHERVVVYSNMDDGPGKDPPLGYVGK